MKIKDFKLERFFSEYEFKVKYQLSPSDCESLSMGELIDNADSASLDIWKNLTLGYTETKGHPLLREEVKKLYETVDQSDLLILAPEEGIFVAMHTLLKRGDHIISMFPTYQSLYEIARSIGCKVIRWELRLDDEKWNLDLDFLKSVITEKTRLLILNFPNNPTGFHPDRKTLDEILNVARKHNLFIFSDEMYRLLEPKEKDRLPSIVDLYDNTVVLSGLSKSFALPGLRIGWLVVKNKSIFERFEAFKDYTTICCSAPSEILAIIALREKKKILKRNLTLIKNNQKKAEMFFRRYPGLFTWPRPDAGSVGFPKIEGGISADKFSEDLLEKKSVLVLPGSVFEMKGNYFRIGLGRKDLEAALGLMSEYIEESNLI